MIYPSISAHFLSIGLLELNLNCQRIILYKIILRIKANLPRYLQLVLLSISLRMGIILNICILNNKFTLKLMHIYSSLMKYQLSIMPLTLFLIKCHLNWETLPKIAKYRHNNLCFACNFLHFTLKFVHIFISSTKKCLAIDTILTGESILKLVAGYCRYQKEVTLPSFFYTFLEEFCCT